MRSQNYEIPHAISSGTAAGFAGPRMPTNVAKHIVHVEISVTLRDRRVRLVEDCSLLALSPNSGSSSRNPTLGSYPPPSWEPGLSLPPHKTYSVRWLRCPAPQQVAQWLVALRLVAPQALLVPLHWWYHSRSCSHALPQPHQGYPSQGMCRWHDA